MAKSNTPQTGRLGVVESVEQVHIGGRLRHARKLSGMNMKQVADQVGCSESFISKLERDKVQPSLSLLHRLVTVLGINIANLFDGGRPKDEPVFIMRSGVRPRIHTTKRPKTEGVVLEQVAPLSPNSLLEVNLHVIAPSGGGHEEISHAGEEVGFVLAGEVVLTVCGRTYRLGAGDSFAFPSDLPHAYNNPGTVEARILWVNTPPTF